jgi:hypothetical protein
VSRLLLYVSNPERKRRFSIGTGIYRSGDHLVVRKNPLDAAAAEHIAALAHTYGVLSALPGLSEHLVVAEPRMSSSGAEFDFIEGTSAERELLDLILADRPVEVLAMLDRLLAVIDVLPSTWENPAQQDDFVAVFGRTYDGVQDCVRDGPFDFNFDNIIIGRDGRWHLIDYEWAFSMALPKRFIFQRFLYHFFCARHRETLRHHARRIASLWIATGVCVPQYVHERYASYFSDLGEAAAAEAGLREYILEAPAPEPPIGFHDPAVPVGDTEELGLAAIIEERHRYLNRTAQLEEQLACLAADLDTVRADRDLILSSRTYKLATLLSRARFWR